MADSLDVVDINELIAAETITDSDLLPIEQASTPKKVTGKVLLNWIISKLKASKDLPLSGGSMTGPIDMAGHPLSGLANPTTPSGAVSKEYADNTFPRISLVWENSAKGDTFESQTLNLGLDEYDMYIVMARHSTTIPGIVSAIGKTGYSLRLMGIGGGSTFTESIRSVSYSSGSLTFGNAAFNGATNNNFLIPVFIYGIKGVLKA